MSGTIKKRFSMTSIAYKTEWLDRTKNMRFYPFVFTGNDPRKGWRIPLNEIKYNEQRDEETGFGHFGARHMDHELMTGRQSVDPMAADNRNQSIVINPSTDFSRKSQE